MLAVVVVLALTLSGNSEQAVVVEPAPTTAPASSAPTTTASPPVAFDDGDGTVAEPGEAPAIEPAESAGPLTPQPAAPPEFGPLAGIASRQTTTTSTSSATAAGPPTENGENRGPASNRRPATTKAPTTTAASSATQECYTDHGREYCYDPTVCPEPSSGYRPQPGETRIGDTSGNEYRVYHVRWLPDLCQWWVCSSSKVTGWSICGELEPGVRWTDRRPVGAPTTTVPDKVVLPNFVGMSGDAAINAIEENPFLMYCDLGDKPRIPGVVLSQEPPAGTESQWYEKYCIFLRIVDPSTRVPNLIGTDVKLAYKDLWPLGMAPRLTKKSEPPPSPELAYKIYTQTPAAGAEIGAGNWLVYVEGYSSWDDTTTTTTTEPPSTTEPPATTEPPSTTTPPATTEPPSTTASPATTEPPPTTTPPATTEPPTTIDG